LSCRAIGLATDPLTGRLFGSKAFGNPCRTPIPVLLAAVLALVPLALRLVAPNLVGGTRLLLVLVLIGSQLMLLKWNIAAGLSPCL
jgi:hypothetical protein